MCMGCIMRAETKAHLDNILDSLAGADGGARYVHFMRALEQLDKQADEGDSVSNVIFTTLERFSKLIDALQPKSNNV